MLVLTYGLVGDKSVTAVGLFVCISVCLSVSDWSTQVSVLVLTYSLVGGKSVTAVCLSVSD